MSNLEKLRLKWNVKLTFLLYVLSQGHVPLHTVGKTKHVETRVNIVFTAFPFGLQHITHNEMVCYAHVLLWSCHDNSKVAFVATDILRTRKF